MKKYFHIIHNTCYRSCHIYPAALLLGVCGWGCKFGSAVVNSFPTIKAVIYLYDLTGTTLQRCILAITCDRSARIWEINIKNFITGEKYNISLMLYYINVDLLRSAYQTGKWSWVPGYSSLRPPTESLNVSGCVHRLLVHLACSPSYCSWRLSHPATQGNLGNYNKITPFNLIKLLFWILLLMLSLQMLS